MPSPVRNHPIAALRAMGRLVKDPYDLPNVFTVIENLPGRAPIRNLERLRASADGRSLLASKPALSERLVDRAGLRALPPHTLGHAYAEFAERNGITAEGIIAAAELGRTKTASWPEDLRYIEERLRDSHDLGHVVTGYGTDVGGELAILAFGLAQVFQPGVGLICGLAYVRRHPPVNAMMTLGYRRGQRAAYLAAVHWEDLLERPLDDVRAQLRIDPLPAYAPIATEDLVPWYRAAA